jgi:hypothetical protein
MAVSQNQSPVAPALVVRPLTNFGPGDPGSVRAAFAAAAGCELHQTWLPRPDEQFAPAQVRVGWRGNALLLFAELTDHDIFTRATAINQRMWELGDALEIFLKPAGAPGYYEYHVTPNNLHLQLAFPDAGAVHDLRRNGMEKYLLAGDVFHSQTWVQSELNRWLVYAEIPATALGSNLTTLAGQRWHFSFSRYDASRDGKSPVISSTSPHTKPDFHCQAEWGVLDFAAAAA